MDVSNINFAEIITTTINSILQSLFSSIDNTLYSVLDDMVFINENIVQDNFFKNILDSSSSNTILIIANALLIAFLLYYSIQLFLTFYSSKTIERPYQFLFKFILVAIFMNHSFFFCEKIIFLISSLSLAIRNIGETFFQSSICFSSMIELFYSIASNDTRFYIIFV